MMLRSVSQYLRVFAVLVFSSMLLACSKPATDNAEDSGDVVCAPSENIAACFFRGGLIQGDSPTIPIYEALKDALTLPLEELRAKRYVGRMGEPSNRTFEEIFNDYFTGGPRLGDGSYISATTEGFLEAIKQPEARPALKALVDGLEEAIRNGEYWNEDGSYGQPKED